MNTTLLEEVREILLSHRIVLDALRLSDPQDGADARLVFQADGRETKTYAAVIRDEITDTAARLMLLPPHDALVVAPYIGPSSADVLRSRGADYVDAAGNMHFDWDRVLIHMQGFRPKNRVARSGDQSRIFSRSGLQVVFVLLCWPDLAAAPLREIAEVSGTSLGTVHKVVDEMAASGYLYDSSDGRRLSRGRELVSRWVENYVTRLSPKLELGRFAGPEGQWWRSLPDGARDGVSLGGETAASLIDPFLRPSTVTLYADEVPSKLLVAARLRRDEVGGEVYVRRRFWTQPADTPPVELVPEVLVYADLIASGDPRQVEHAQRMRSSNDRLVALDQS